ncbi:hypothetical protein EI534_06695 [Pseudomonas frederiksbergensis]|nr:hypothetical protein [Pseudomonas frederiksbergensis]
MDQVWFSPNAPASRLPNGKHACSSCRACEAAFGCEAVVNPIDAVCLTHRNLWFYDCFAAERSLAGSTAATALRVRGRGTVRDCHSHSLRHAIDRMVNPAQRILMEHHASQSIDHERRGTVGPGRLR